MTATEEAKGSLLTQFLTRDNTVFTFVDGLIAAERDLLERAKDRDIVHRTDMPAGALTLDLASGVRLVVMYDIQTDTHVAHATLLLK